MKVITIGRGSENNIVIDDAQVSRTHLQLVQNDNGACSVVDLNSTNGTFVNGRKITGEVHLQPHDIIRIGNTTLPWQEYINPHIATRQKQMCNVRPTPKPKKTWWYVAACVVFMLFAGGGIGYYYYYNGKEQEKIEAAKRNQEEIQKEQLRQEAEQKAKAAKRLQNEADDLLRQALISQNDKSKALAEAKQKEATEAKKRADEAIAAQRKTEKDNKELERKAQKAEEDRRESDRVAQKAEKDKKEALVVAKLAEQKQLYAEERARLISEFYGMCDSLRSEEAVLALGKLNKKDISKSKAINELKKNFSNAKDDNGRMRTIINAVLTSKKEYTDMERQLTGFFNKERSQMSEEFAMQVLVHLNHTTPEQNSSAKDALSSLFNNADNNYKQQIKDAINALKE